MVKLNGTIQMYQALCANFLRRTGSMGFLGATRNPNAAEQALHVVSGVPEEPVSWLHTLVSKLYDIKTDDQWFRSNFGTYPDGGAHVFKNLRATYPRRRSFRYLSVKEDGIPAGLRDAVKYGLELGVRS